MLDTNPYQEKVRRSQSEYERLLKWEPIKRVVSSVVGTGSAFGAFELFTHHEGRIGIAATLFSVYQAWSVWAHSGNSIAASREAHIKEEAAITQGEELEAKIFKELIASGFEDPAAQLEVIWRDDQSYRGGQTQETPVS